MIPYTLNEEEIGTPYKSGSEKGRVGVALRDDDDESDDDDDDDFDPELLAGV